MFVHLSPGGGKLISGSVGSPHPFSMSLGSSNPFSVSCRIFYAELLAALITLIMFYQASHARLVSHTLLSHGS